MQHSIICHYNYNYNCPTMPLLDMWCTWPASTTISWHILAHIIQWFKVFQTAENKRSTIF